MTTPTSGAREPERQTADAPQVWWWRRIADILWRPTWLAGRDWALALVFTLANVAGSASASWYLSWQGNDAPGAGVWAARYGVLGAFVLVLGLGLRGWAWRHTIRTVNGGALVVVEQSVDWDQEPSREVFLGRVERAHTSTVQVPGPFALHPEWGWGSDADAARQWGARVRELATAYEIVLRSGPQRGPTTLYVWAWWPVAVALGLRAGLLDREGRLRVAPRPSFGRQAKIVNPGPLGAAASIADPVTAKRLTQPLPARVFGITRRGAVRADDPVSGRVTGRILFLRFTAGAFANEGGGEPLGLAIADYSGDSNVAGALVAAGSSMEFRELWAVPAMGRTHPITAAGQLAAEARDWISTNSQGADVVLLATQVPAEVGVLLGIAAGSGGNPAWPDHVWPLHWAGRGDEFVVPALDLGLAVPGRA